MADLQSVDRFSPTSDRSESCFVCDHGDLSLHAKVLLMRTDRSEVGPGSVEPANKLILRGSAVGPDLAPLVRMRVVGYVRVSTEEQACTGVSLAAQTEKIRAYCALYNLELLDLIEDAGVSAKTLVRPGLRRALDAMDSGKGDGLIVAKLDRLTRSVIDIGRLIDDYFSERRGKSLFSVADSIDTRTAAGRMVLNILVSVSQWEREAIGERTRDALRHKRDTGQVFNHPPLGYEVVGEQLVEVASELQTVEEIRRLAAIGSSQREICSALTASGYSTKRGGAWRPSTIQSILRRAP